MLFDPPSHLGERRALDVRRACNPSIELPQATVVREPSTFTELVVTGVAQWFRDRLRWVRPRMIPLVAAVIGFGITVTAVNQLSRPPQPTESASISAASHSMYQPGRIRIVLQQ